jgi:hypothetical protein
MCFIEDFLNKVHEEENREYQLAMAAMRKQQEEAKAKAAKTRKESNNG